MYDKYFSENTDEVIIIGLAARDESRGVRSPRVYIENSQGEPIPVKSSEYRKLPMLAAHLVPDYNYYRRYVVVDRRVGKIYRFKLSPVSYPDDPEVMGDNIGRACPLKDIPHVHKLSHIMRHGTAGVLIAYPLGAIGNQVKWVTDPDFVEALKNIRIKETSDVTELSYMFTVSEKDGITLRYVSKYLAATILSPNIRNCAASEIKDWWLAHGKPSGEWTITIKPCDDMIEYAIMTDAVIPVQLGWDHITDISK